MCVRFYPDFIIAVDVHNAIERRIRWKEKNPDMKAEDTLQNLLEDILISPAGCVERQSEIIDSDLCNAFVGYGSNTWNVKDYEMYLCKHPELFSKINDKRLFRLNLDQISINEENPDTFSKRFCRGLLKQNTYGTDFLEKFDLY